MNLPEKGTPVWIILGIERKKGEVLEVVPTTHDRPGYALVKVDGLAHPVQRPLSQLVMVEDRHAA